MRIISDIVNTVILGPCEDILKGIPDNSCDSFVGDIPYGLGKSEPTATQIDAYLNGATLDVKGDFMGTDWTIPSVPVWREINRIVKPGGYVLSFGATRTFDIIELGMKAAGLTDEDTFARPFGTNLLQWVTGQGMPKSRNVFKTDIVPAVEKELRERGLDRKPVWTSNRPDELPLTVHLIPIFGKSYTVIEYQDGSFVMDPELQRWAGHGTGLKPSWEPILVMRKEGSAFVHPKLDAPFIYTGKTSTREKTLNGQIYNDHSTVKPLKLMTKLVEWTTPVGGIVLDSYCGSGSTLHAAYEAGRKFIGIEKDPKFHALASERMRIVMMQREPTAEEILAQFEDVS